MTATGRRRPLTRARPATPARPALNRHGITDP